MALSNTNTLYGNSGGNIPANGGQQRLALDNLIRRELKVGDPNDPKQIADALLNRFKDDPRANAITQEARGLPFLQSSAITMPITQAATSSQAELKQAKDDVERDLQELLTNSLLKDVTPELEGWAQSVRNAIQEGSTSARFSLDPRQRDKTFAIRRQLGDYARLSRLVGALTPTLNMVYRKFAQSLDEAASVLLVLMGEALADSGVNGGRFLLQVPYSDLQMRRDAVIYALRNLSGATQEAYGPNEWPRGLDGYRRLFRELEAQGQGDLRALLTENELSRVLDEMLTRADHGRARGLRALGVTAQVDLERFRRLVVVVQDLAVDDSGQPVPWSPPLTAFLEALLLFAEAFDGTGGFRLMRIARPPILFYGLYGMRTVDPAEDRLLQLIMQRNLLADRLDCFLECGCSGDALVCQIILDKILYDSDRAIDFYAIGNRNFGVPEQRASAYGLVIEAFSNTDGQSGTDTFTFEKCGNSDNTRISKIQNILNSLIQQLQPDDYDDLLDPDNANNEAFLAILKQELCLQRENEKRWRNMVETMAPDCAGFENVYTHMDSVLIEALARIDPNVETCPAIDVIVPPTIDASLGMGALTQILGLGNQ